MQKEYSHAKLKTIAMAALILCSIGTNSIYAQIQSNKPYGTFNGSNPNPTTPAPNNWYDGGSQIQGSKPTVTIISPQPTTPAPSSGGGSVISPPTTAAPITAGRDTTSSNTPRVTLEIAAGQKSLLSANQTRPKQDESQPGESYGSFVDGPFNPYRRSNTDIVRAIVPNSENYSAYLPFGTEFFNPAGWSLSPAVNFLSARSGQMGNMDMRHWIFSVFNASPSQAYAITHSENYTAVGQGFHGYMPLIGHPNFQQFNSLSLFKTKPRTENHDYFEAAFTPTAFAGTSTHSDKHMIIHPALPEASCIKRTASPYEACGRGLSATYGFAHPSNMIEEGEFVYAFAMHIPATGHAGNGSFADLNTSAWSENGRAGPVLVRCNKAYLGRTGNPANLNGHYWEIFNAAKQWQYITRWSWADASLPNAGIKPYVFFQKYNADAKDAQYQNNQRPPSWIASYGLAQAVRKVNDKYVVMGTYYNQYRKGGEPHYAYTTTLASPLQLENTISPVTLIKNGMPVNPLAFGGQDPFSIQSAGYISVFDPADPDLNFKNITQNISRPVWVARQNMDGYMSYPIRFQGF